MRITSGAPQLQGPPSGAGGPKIGGSGGNDFGGMLKDILEDVNQSQIASQTMQNEYMAGKTPVDIHNLMITMEKASTTMALTMQVRNKVLEAYQEISRTQV